MSSKERLSSETHPVNLLEDHYRLLIESISDHAIISLDPSGYISTWNSGAERLKQYKASEVVGKHFSSFYTADAIAKDYPDMVLREAQKWGRFEDEGWRLRKDGSSFWANVVITPIYDQHNILAGFSKVTRDLTDRKKAEDDLYRAYEEIKESEERFRLLIHGVTDYAIFMLNPAGNVATWNEGAKRMKGYTANEIIGKYFSKFYGQQAIKEGKPEQALQQARAEGHFEGEGWRYRKDGSAFWASVVLTAIYNENKELIGFSKITRDLTEKKKMEQQLFQMHEELKESEERTRLLIDSIKDYAILMLSPDGIVSSWNKGARLIKGYEEHEIVGKHFSTFYARDAIESGYPQYELTKAIEAGHFEDEGWRIRKNGTAFWANVVLTPIYNSYNRLLGFAKITRDLTERRQHEQTLEQKNRELSRINKELDNFVYTASHELKSPIANLEGLLHVLEEDMGVGIEKHKEVLTMMEGAVVSLKNVISNLADVKRLQQESPEGINIPDLINEVKETLHRLISESNATIKVVTDGFEHLHYPRESLRNILQNLLVNTIQHTDPEQKPEVTIRTYLSKKGKFVLSVGDNGNGIANIDITRLHSMFSREGVKVQGSNISLYVVNKILEYSGDKIEVKSKSGEGVAFHVYFNQKGY